LLLGHVREQAVRVLGLPRDQVINPQQPLNELGLDSLMAVELRNALGAGLERSLSTTLLFDYPTLDALVDHLLGDLAPAETPPQDPTPPQASAPTTPSPGAADIAALSEDEAEALLLAELAQLKREGRKHG
jgi:acyl carrier protein